jgi:uncharacterized protein (TIGR02452 family)
LDTNFGAIYSSNVTIFRSSQETGYRFLSLPKKLSIISIGAINKQRASNPLLTEEEIEITKNRIRTIFRIAIINGHNILILGAWGCGAFKNPPSLMAGLFKSIIDEPEFKNKIWHIVFAIKKKGRDKAIYDAFNDIFHYCPEKFYHNVSCPTEPVSGTTTGAVG